MPNAQHTPGPWREHEVQPDAWTRQVWTDESHGSVMIATTGGMDKDANARLIAAAPDLLAALASAWDYWQALNPEYLFRDDPHAEAEILEWRGNVETVRAAIAKAAR